MKRLQIYIEEELDDALGREARRSGTSKAALVRRFVADRLDDAPVRSGDALDRLVGAYDCESDDIDEVVYGS